MAVQNEIPFDEQPPPLPTSSIPNKTEVKIGDEVLLPGMIHQNVNVDLLMIDQASKEVNTIKNELIYVSHSRESTKIFPSSFKRNDSRISDERKTTQFHKKIEDDDNCNQNAAHFNIQNGINYNSAPVTMRKKKLDYTELHSVTPLVTVKVEEEFNDLFNTVLSIEESNRNSIILPVDTEHLEEQFEKIFENTYEFVDNKDAESTKSKKTKSQLKEKRNNIFNEKIAKRVQIWNDNIAECKKENDNLNIKTIDNLPHDNGKSEFDNIYNKLRKQRDSRLNNNILTTKETLFNNETIVQNLNENCEEMITNKWDPKNGSNFIIPDIVCNVENQFDAIYENTIETKDISGDLLVPENMPSITPTPIGLDRAEELFNNIYTKTFKTEDMSTLHNKQIMLSKSNIKNNSNPYTFRVIKDNFSDRSISLDNYQEQHRRKPLRNVFTSKTVKKDNPELKISNIESVLQEVDYKNENTVDTTRIIKKNVIKLWQSISVKDSMKNYNKDTQVATKNYNNDAQVATKIENDLRMPSVKDMVKKFSQFEPLKYPKTKKQRCEDILEVISVPPEVLTEPITENELIEKEEEKPIELSKSSKPKPGNFKKMLQFFERLSKRT